MINSSILPTNIFKKTNVDKYIVHQVVNIHQMVLHHLVNKIPAYEVSVTLRAIELRAERTSETPPHLQFQVGF